MENVVIPSCFHAFFDDKMNLDEVLDLISMNYRLRQAKSKHRYAIHHTEASGFFTNVDDPTKPSGKRKIRRCSEESLWQALSDWYDTQSTSEINFEQLYYKWLDWKTTPRNQANIRRIEYSWKTYYKNEPLSKELISKPLRQVTVLELRKWAEDMMCKHEPDKKKFSRMFCIIKQCLEYASDEDVGILQHNPWVNARKKLNRSLIVPKPLPSDTSQVFTDEERRLIRKYVYEDLHNSKIAPTSAGLQILFLFETGMRIGEACGLKWSDIKDGRIFIRRQADNYRVKDHTKTACGYRDIPLTTEARRILDDVKKYNDMHGFHAEWVFQSNQAKYDYRLGYTAAGNKLTRLCRRMDTEHKSPHKCRKTCISVLLDSPNINNRTVQRFAGHHELSTTLNYYSYERKTKDAQAQAIDDALSLD